jgi:exonuclease III
VICLQETKLTSPSSFKAATFLPSSTSSFVALDAIGTSGGIITAWDLCVVALDRSVSKRSISATADAQPIAITNVYTPRNVVLCPAFFVELVELATQSTCPWLVLDDFNIARTQKDKNTDHFDAMSATLFTDTVDALLLQELSLLDRRFTWMNKREVPTLVRLDCVFINAA